jgi:Baseplate J-like protein
MFRLELDKDFQHKVYPAIYTIKMKDVTQSTANTLPSEPYTPVIQSISFSYTATDQVNISVGTTQANTAAFNTLFANFNGRKIQFFHLDIFGEAEQHGYLKTLAQRSSSGVNLAVHLLPQYPLTGNFYMGIEKIYPLETLNTLFQLLEASADPEAATEVITWSILFQNEWHVFSPTEVPSDATGHFLKSGIIKYIIPDFADTNNTLFDSGKVWIRGQVAKNVNAVCKCINIHTQAAKAIYNAAAGSIIPRHTIPAQTITKLVNKLSAVKKIDQPYGSFGGRSLEESKTFYTRVSERLRHKNRAVTVWDYERMVLQQFPEIYKVKCLNHSSKEGTDCCAFRKPGEVTLVVIPNLSNQNAAVAAEPKVSLDTISRVETYLRQYNSMFITTRVQNPDYEKLRIKCKVRFRSEEGFGHYVTRLVNDISNFLMPWAYDSTLDITFGGRVQKSMLLNFIDDLPYVDFVTEFTIDHITDVKKNIIRTNVDEVIVDDPRAILIADILESDIVKFKENDCS